MTRQALGGLAPGRAAGRRRRRRGRRGGRRPASDERSAARPHDHLRPDPQPRGGAAASRSRPRRQLAVGEALAAGDERRGRGRPGDLGRDQRRGRVAAAGGAGAVPAFHSARSCWRSAAPRRGRREIGRPGSATTAARSVSRCAARRSAGRAVEEVAVGARGSSPASPSGCLVERSRLRSNLAPPVADGPRREGEPRQVDARGRRVLEREEDLEERRAGRGCARGSAPRPGARKGRSWWP